jgi:glucokinase
VLGETAQLTNVPWKVDGQRVREHFAFKRVDLLNDLQAMAYGVTVLQASEIHVLQEGSARQGGNVALIAAGTGLGEALLVELDGKRIALPSEGGRADYSARNEREIRVLRSLVAATGRAAVEHVVSGPGLVHIHRAIHDKPCRDVENLGDRDIPAAITTAALERKCPACMETLETFVDAYGAEAGNVALRMVSTGGLFVGGGIAPKILGALGDGRFMAAFRAKTPFEPLLDAVPVKVIMNSETGLLGAAVFAAGQR